VIPRRLTGATTFNVPTFITFAERYFQKPAATHQPY